MTVPVVYCQRDHWDQLGHCPGITIHDYGCYVTSAAMLAVLFGNTVDPPGLNQLWLGGYVNGCDATDYLLPGTYPSITLEATPWGREHLFGLGPDQSAIIQIDGTATLGYITHYLAFDHVEGNRVIAVDPWYGDLCDVEARYGYVIQKVAIYRGPTGPGVPVAPPKVGAYSSSEGTMVLIAHPDHPGRLDLLCVDKQGRLARTWSDGGAGGLNHIGEPGYPAWVDNGTPPSGPIVPGTLGVCVDDLSRLVVTAADPDGQGYLLVIRDDGGLDQEWSPIAAAVSVPAVAEDSA